jgi:hypothetical protein
VTARRRIEIGGVHIAPKVFEHCLDQALGLGMMNEGGLERRKDSDKLFHRHVVLRGGRIIFAECVLDHFRGEIGKGESAGARRICKQLPPIQELPALLIIKF